MTRSPEPPPLSPPQPPLDPREGELRPHDGADVGFAGAWRVGFRAGWQAAVDAVFSPDTSIPMTVDEALAAAPTLGTEFVPFGTMADTGG